MKNSQKLYLDSCSFIDLVKEQVGLLPSERDKDAWHLKQLMKAHQQRDAPAQPRTCQTLIDRETCLVKTSSSKPKRSAKLSDAERHKRFVDMAKEVGASEKPEDFDRAFKKVAKTK